MNAEYESSWESGFTPSNSPRSWEEVRKKIIQEKHISMLPYSLKDLAAIYKVCIPTFKRMLEPYKDQLGKQDGRYFSIPQLKFILEHIDLPSTYTLTDLAQVYNVSVPTFKGWLDRFHHELGEKEGHFHSLRQLYIIISKLGIPSIEGKQQDDFVSLLRLCSGKDLLLLFGYLCYCFSYCLSFTECLGFC